MRVIDHVRTGDWVTAARVRGYSLVMLAFSILILAGWFAMSDGLIDRAGKPIGTDFANVYAAGTLVRQGRAPDAYDIRLQHDAEKRVFGRDDVPLFGWHYPPFFFGIAAVVATLPYLGGLLLWMVLSLPAYLAAIRAILPRPETVLAAAAFPAVFVNVGHGQNGFFTAALLGSALQIIDRRPALAGALVGLMAYKPQFGLLIPVALIAGKRWITIATAALTVAVLIALSIACLGMDAWHAFFTSTGYTQTIILEQGATGWEKIQSIFSAVRMWGGSIALAYGAQFALAIVLAASIVWLWHSRAAHELKAAGLAIACLLATPYVLDYDLVVLGVAIAFLVRHGLTHGFRDYEVTLLALAWAMPLVARSLMAATTIPLGFLILAALFVMTMLRAIEAMGGIVWRKSAGNGATSMARSAG